jgi:hypothetical protein
LSDLKQKVIQVNEQSQRFETWEAMASAIIGSGTYALDGQDEAQIRVLVEWLRQGRKQSFDWRRTYQDIYDFWSKHRPLLPPLNEMEKLVEFPPEKH